MNPAQVTARLRPWLAELPALLREADINTNTGADADANTETDADTREFCLASLRALCAEELLVHKVASELGRAGVRWAPLGRLLLVVSENDVLGTVFALLGALVTGNTVRVKTRYTMDVLSSLRRALGLDDDTCELLDWRSDGQDDDALMADIDGVVVAGGDAAIRHYRRIAPAHVRLIEWGPKLSAVAIGADADAGDAQAMARLLSDITLFGQRVCSSPQFVLVAAERAAAVRAGLAGRLHELPVLPEDERLAQYARAQELRLRGLLDGCVAVDFAASTGWGLTLSSRFDPALWLHRGVHLVAGDVGELLATVARRYRRRLQTLGTWALPGHLSGRHHGFTRVCPIGAMHARSPLEPHDGLFELTPLVDFLAT